MSYDQSEHMMHRKRRESYAFKNIALARLVNVRRNVILAQHDALRLSGRPGSKDQRAHIMYINLAVDERPVAQCNKLLTFSDPIGK